MADRTTRRCATGRALALLASVLAVSGEGCGGGSRAREEGSDIPFADPRPVTIRGYEDDAMEPFLTRDGRYLLFNDRNDPARNTDLHYAATIDDLTFEYRGRIEGVATPALEGVATTDRDGRLYFVSSRSYEQTLATIYGGVFVDGVVSGIELVHGLGEGTPGRVAFDVEVSPDGDTLYFVDADFQANRPVTADLVIASRRGDTFARDAASGVTLQNVNTAALEYAACISSDGRTLFFTRAPTDGTGVPSLWVAGRSSLGSPFELPVPVVAAAGFVEGPALSPDERSLYYHRLDGDRFTIHRLTRP